MIVNNHNNIESDTLYSFLLRRVEQPNLTDLIEISNNMLALYGEENDKTLYPTEYFFLKEISSELSERMECITKSADKTNEQGLMNCEEITIVDYGCGQGLASLSMLDWLYQRNGNLNNIKTVKLVDKDSKALSRALLHFSILFPTIEVIAYNQDFLDKKFSVDCNSVLTINLFSHVFNAKTCYADCIKDIILNGHNLFMHNIIIEDISSNGDIVRNRQNFCDYLSCSIEDYTGCKSIVDFKYMPKSRGAKKVLRHFVLSRTSIDSFSIPKVKNNFSFLCPGEPTKKLTNVPQCLLWYNTPLEKSKYIENLDNENKISLKENYLSADFKDEYKKSADELNPHTIKDCAEKFHQSHICHAISCGLSCGQDIISIYEKAAADGQTEAYNNLGVLFFQLNDTNGENIHKAITYFRLAAKGGASSAMMNLASYYMSDGKEKEAFEYYKKAAELKNTNGLFNLAVIYNFGLINQEIDLKQAEKLYRQCINEVNRSKDSEYRDYHIQSSCCLNLMLMMWKRGEHYLDLLTVYNLAKKPSDELRYCKEILQIIFTRRFSKDVKDILFLKDAKADEKPFIKYNCAIFLYNGLLLKSFNVKIEKDKETAFSIVKSLVETEDEFNVWTNKEKYVFPIYAKWLHSDKKGSGGLDEKYWRKAARADKDNACAYMTNIAICAEMSDDEKKSIWKRFAFADGCKSCHECSNYDTLLRLCPKAQYRWAKEYECDKEFAMSLMHKSANQHFDAALFYLGFQQAINKELPSFKEDGLFNTMARIGIVVSPPKQYEVLYPILTKDCYYYYLQGAASAGISISRSILPFVAKCRDDKYNFIYWACVSYAKRNNEEMKLCILDFFKEKCNKSLDSYFKPKTLCEREMLSYAESFAKSTKNITFICELAKFYLQGNSLYKARELYLIAKEKGCKNLDEILGNINSRIEDIEKEEKRKSYRSYDYYDEPDYMRDSWDAMTDGMYGDMPDGFDGDYGFLGY